MNRSIDHRHRLQSLSVDGGRILKPQLPVARRVRAAMIASSSVPRTVPARRAGRSERERLVQHGSRWAFVGFR